MPRRPLLADDQGAASSPRPPPPGRSPSSPPGPTPARLQSPSAEGGRYLPLRQNGRSSPSRRSTPWPSTCAAPRARTPAPRFSRRERERQRRERHPEATLTLHRRADIFTEQLGGHFYWTATAAARLRGCGRAAAQEHRAARANVSGPDSGRLFTPGATPLSRIATAGRQRWIVRGMAALLVLLAAGGAWWMSSRFFLGLRADGTRAPRLAIVVLPFSNLSGDPSQDYFADGMTEDLRRIVAPRWELRDSRNTAFTFKGKAVEPGKSAASWASAMCSRAASGVRANRPRRRAAHRRRHRRTPVGRADGRR